MSEFLCQVDEIGEYGKEIRLNPPASARFGQSGTPVYLMLFRMADGVTAYRNLCPHQLRSLNWGPDRFMVTPDSRVVCAHHGAAFELSTGLCVQGPCEGASLESATVEIRDGKVWLADN